MQMKTAAALRAAAEGLPGSPAAFAGLTIDDGWQEVWRMCPPEAEAEVIVSVHRAPAMFWRIQCPAKEVDLVTGSGCHDLAYQIATAVAEGMLGGKR
jgi:hypothetical protein